MATWIDSDQRAFLISRYPAFIDAQNNKNTFRFWPQIYEVWWNRWPVDTHSALDLTTENQAEFVARVQKAKEKQIHNWFFNRTRGSGGGSGRGTRAARISTGKKRAPVQAYMYYFYKDKIKAQVIRLWKKANYTERTSSLALDRQPEVEAQDIDEETDEDEDTKGIPFAFKMKIAKQMWSIESEAVKKEVEERRVLDAAPPEDHQDESMRVARLVTYQQNIDRLSHTANNILKHLERTTGMAATLLIGGPVPVLGGKVTCWSFCNGLTAEKQVGFTDFYPEFHRKVMRPFAEHVNFVFPEAIRNARAAPAAEDLSEESSDHEPTNDVPAQAIPQPAAAAKAPRMRLSMSTGGKRPRPRSKSIFRPAVTEDSQDVEPDVPGLMQGCSENPADVPGLMQGCSENPADVPGLMQGCSENPADVPGLMQGCSENPADVPGLMQGCSENPAGIPGILSLLGIHVPDVPSLDQNTPTLDFESFGIDLGAMDLSSLTAAETLELMNYTIDDPHANHGSPATFTHSNAAIPIPAPIEYVAPVPVPTPMEVDPPISASTEIVVPVPRLINPDPALIERVVPAPAPIERVVPAPAPIQSIVPIPAPIERIVPAPIEHVAPAPKPMETILPIPASAEIASPVSTPIIPVPAPIEHVILAPVLMKAIDPHANTSSATPGNKTFNFDQSILPDWLGKGLKYMAGLSNDPEWVTLLRELLKHEARLGYTTGCKTWISTDGCPKALDWWQYEGRHTLTRLPVINVVTFPNELRKWWISLQPNARRGTSLLRTTNAKNANWSGLQHGGQDGMYAIVVCLSWFMVSLPPPVDQRAFAELVDDVTWVLTCLNLPNGTPTSTSRRQSRGSTTAQKRSTPEAFDQQLPAKRGRR